MNRFKFALAAAVLGGVSVALATDYYVDSENGNDSQAGTSAETAWKSLVRVNEARAILKGGDRVLFRRGGLWRGSLYPGSGSVGQPLVYTSYGEGPKPILERSVDRSKPEDWYEIAPGVWSTKRTEPKASAPFWNSAATGLGNWNASFQDGAAGSVKVMTENGVSFVRVTLDRAAAEREAHTLQLWGPEIKNLPSSVLLKMRMRATKPVKIEESRIGLGLNHLPWTASVRGIVRGASQQPLDANWREVTAVMTRGGSNAPADGYFHWSIGDLLEAGTTLDIQFLEMCVTEVDTSTFIAKDVGILILNHGEKWGVKRMYGAHELKNDLDFWYDPEEGTVLVKYPENPAKAFASVELALTVHVVSEGGCHDVTYDGLAVRYGASHGFGGGTTENIIIRNCDIYWIGGGLQYWKRNKQGVRYPVRFGNGIEFWGTCRNNLVERNRLWQVYDAALTNQTLGDPRPEVDVIWRDNVIWQAEYSFEYWNHDPRSFTGNILFEHNTCIDAGYCWSHGQRPNPNGAHLMFYDNAAPTTNFVVRYNIFVRTTERSTRMFNDWRAKTAGAHDGLEMYDNLYWIPEGTTYEYHLHGRDRRANPATTAMKFEQAQFKAYVAATGLDKGSVVVKPQFKDEAKRDYRLKKPILAPDGTVYGARE